MIRKKLKGEWRKRGERSKGAECLIYGALLILLLPILIVFCLVPVLLIELIRTPIKYKKYKFSRYQIDFPKKYSWLDEPHFDNEAYTAVKENNLPVSYLKWSDNYSSAGYFSYNGILLYFCEAFCFCVEDNQIYFHSEHLNIAEDPMYYTYKAEICDDNGEYIEQNIPLEEAIKLSLEHYNYHASKIENQTCERMVFFCTINDKAYEHKSRSSYRDLIDSMRKMDCFVLYKSDELATAIKEFIANN